MSLDLMVKVLGWGMTIIPMAIFIALSGYMVLGAAADDEVIKALVLLGAAIFFIGLTILIVAYFTTFLTFAPQEISFLFS